MRLNKDDILRLIEEGYMMVNSHPTLPLNIYNYTRKTQFERAWNEYTLLARGLVLDLDYNVVAHPFKKFFNFEEHQLSDIPDEKYEIYDKMDGSLGILFFYAGEWHIATRGSFVSDQALRAKEILKAYDLRGLNTRYTHLFEIIYPENRIVVNYNGAEKLVLLGLIDTETGHDYGHSYISAYIEGACFGYCTPFEVVKRYEDASIQELKARNIPNEEGYILRYYPSNFRMKVKFEDYCRLHSIITNVSTKDIWECLRDGRDMNELLENTPDEFDDWVRGQIAHLKKDFAEIEEAVRIRVNVLKDSMKDPSSKKEFASLVLNRDFYVGNSAIAFNMFDGKKYDHIIWREIEPAFSKPFFKQNEDAE